MSPSSRLSVSPISIGDCKVEFLGNNISYELSPNNLLISALNAAKIKISQVDNSTKCSAEKLCSNCSSKLIHEDGVEGEGDSPPGNFSFLLLNPKDIDSRSKSLLQDVLNLYMKELPTMKYAANTGKKSRFLERCVSSGKYRTLLLETGGKEPREVVAAISYQIIPANTLYAEIPVTAVSSSYQDKGIGHFLYMELRRRLQDVGVLTLFCWGDKESEGFWIKQGFISVAEVDTKGRARKLPIKADIRRALCIPGGSTLMVSHLNKDLTVPVNPPRTVKLCFPLNPHAKVPSQVSVGAPLALKTTKLEVRTESIKEPNPIVDQIENSDPQASRKDGSLEDEQEIYGLSLPFRIWGCKDMVPQNDVDGNNVVTDTVVAEYGCDAVGRFCMCSGQHVKRRIWESSCSSLKSKKVKGGHQIDCYLHSSWDLTKKEDSQYLDSCGGFSLDLAMNKSLVDATPADSPHLSCQAVPSEKNAEAQIMPIDDHVSGGLPSNVEHPVIMLMNIADDTKKACLTKIVEELGGGVTSSGGTSTHVITGKARRTLNFCTALCSGAWIVSPNWLKASFREGHFVDELAHILEDEDYKVRYRSELKDAVLKAKASPCALLSGYDVCLARHVQPAVDILSEIIKSAGGNVLQGLHKVQEPSRTIFVACEEDMDEALAAAKRGIWTFNSDWLMSCVMRQVLDFDAPQFAEPL